MAIEVHPNNKINQIEYLKKKLKYLAYKISIEMLKNKQDDKNLVKL